MRAVVGRHSQPALVTAAVVFLHLVLAYLFVRRDAARRQGHPLAIAAALPALLIGGLSTLGDRVWHPAAAYVFALSALGASLSLLRLGRSFAVLPALRAVVQRGPYRVVRHPAYACELLMSGAVATTLAPAWAGAGLIVFALAAVVIRIHAEERTLRADPAYDAYAAAVRYRLVPGVW